MSLDDFKRQALQLPFDDREDLARTLYASLEEEDSEPDSVLPPEVKRRYQAYKEGKTKSLSLEELLAGLV